MPRFEIEANGKRFEVEAPDMETAVQALQGAQSGQEQPKQAMPGGALGASNLGVQQGLTANFGDEIMAGLMTPIEMGAQAIRGDDVSMSGAYNRNLERERGMLETAREQHPGATLAGELGGGVALGGQAMKGGLSLLNAAKPTARSMIGRGAGEGAAYGAAFGAGAGEGAADRLTGAGIGAGTGAAMGGALGALGPKMGQSTARKTIPQTDQLKAQSNALYKQADDVGLVVKDSAFDQFVDDVDQLVRNSGFDRGLHKDSAAALRRLVKEKGAPKTLQEVDNLRQVISDAARGREPRDRRIASMMIEKLDNWFKGLKPSDVVSGDPKQAGNLIVKARGLWSQMRKSSIIDEMMENAKDKVGANYTQAELQTALRHEFKSLAKRIRKGTAPGFTADEKKAIQDVVRGASVENALRALGKFAPRGVVGTTLSGGAGYALGGLPGMAGMFAAGEAGKRASGALSAGKTRHVSDLIRSGGNIPSPQITAQQRKLLEALTVTGAQQGQGLVNP